MARQRCTAHLAGRAGAALNQAPAAISSRTTVEAQRGARVGRAFVSAALAGDASAAARLRGCAHATRGDEVTATVARGAAGDVLVGARPRRASRSVGAGARAAAARHEAAAPIAGRSARDPGCRAILRHARARLGNPALVRYAPAAAGGPCRARASDLPPAAVTLWSAPAVAADGRAGAAFRLVAHAANPATAAGERRDAAPAIDRVPAAVARHAALEVFVGAGERRAVRRGRRDARREIEDHVFEDALLRRQQTGRGAALLRKRDVVVRVLVRHMKVAEDRVSALRGDPDGRVEREVLDERGVRASVQGKVGVCALNPGHRAVRHAVGVVTGARDLHQGVRRRSRRIAR